MNIAEQIANYVIGTLVGCVVLYALFFTLADIIPAAESAEPPACVCDDDPNCSIGRLDPDGTGERPVHVIFGEEIVVCELPTRSLR